MLPGKTSTTEQTKMYYVYTLSYPEEMGGAVFYIGSGKQALRQAITNRLPGQSRV